MLKKILFLCTIFIFLVTIFSFFTSIQAQANLFDIQFPIAELGNCGSMGECKTYCDDAVNIGACTAFAEKQGLIVPKEAQKVKVIAEKTGPGGCKNARECDNYCRTPEHGKECVLHAVKEGFISEEEADSMLEFMKDKDKKFTPQKGLSPAHLKGPKEPEEFDKKKAEELIGTIGGPGGCSTFGECDKFCSDIQNNDTCMAYAVEHKLMKTEDAEKFKKLMTIEGPGGCRGRECEKYCNDPAHGDECFNFAKEHNLLPKEEIHRIEKFKDIKNNLEAKGGPGDCRGEEECRNYCSDTTHLEECAAFAVNVGFVDTDKAKDVLMQFVEIERSRPQGTEFGRPNENFSPTRRFIPQDENFKSNSDFSKFGPSPEFEKNFEERFRHFEQFRGDFEHMPLPPEFRNDLQNGFNPPQSFEGGFPPPNNYNFPGNGEFRPDMEFPIPGKFEGFIPSSGFISPNTEGGYVKPPDAGFAYPQGDFTPYAEPGTYLHDPAFNNPYVPSTGNFTPPSNYSYPTATEGSYITPTNEGSYPPSSDDNRSYFLPPSDGAYTSPSDQTILLPTVLFPLFPLLKILF
ncbi:MAG: hypothetical protein NUV64_03065 [Parcubacteria group bacterium]|nr:hypothetical protein [Parcubacteria group bacterium]MCR4342846.1 hypothetical protein [Patescibacteria group bacterium]